MLNACLAGRSLPTASGATKNWAGGGAWDTGKGLKTPINADAVMGTAGLACPPHGSARASKPSALPSWLCQGLPKPKSCAGAPHPHLAWDGDISRAASGALQGVSGVRWDGAWDLQAQSQVQDLKASVVRVCDLRAALGYRTCKHARGMGFACMVPQGPQPGDLVPQVSFMCQRRWATA